MARARNIKPSFFRNEDLAELAYETRLLFIGTWTLADREGRLEDRPKKIKMEIFPADSVDVDKLLQKLHDAKFILRYEVNGKRYIQIVAFLKHQNPHYREPKSTIPQPKSLGLIVDETVPKPEADEALKQCETQVQAEAGPGPALLIPDSGFRIPDSGKKLTPASAGVRPDGRPSCPHEQLIAMYHELLPDCPRVVEWNDARQGLMRSLWREKARPNGRAQGYTTVEGGLAYWRRYFAWVAESKFLTGKTEGKPGQAPFVANLEWLIKPKNFVKVVEGNYHR